MSKRKRSSTWYRHLNREKQSMFEVIYGTKDPVLNQVKPDETAVSSNACFGSFEAQCEGSTSNNLRFSNSSSCNSDWNVSYISSTNNNANIEENIPELENNIVIENQEDDNQFDSISNNISCNTSQRTDTNAVDKLRDWCVSHKITACAIRDLLGILIKADTNDFKNLPKDPRTLLATPKSSLTRNVAPGEYHHFGIKNSITNLYSSYNHVPLEDTISIAINIDGLPLAKSSSSQVYPIIGINRNMKHHKNLFLIGVYHGYDKPNDFNDLLLEFVTEAKDLTINGLPMFGNVYQFKVTMFLFDAVAKASVLYVKGHSGYESCTKCTQEGEYINDRICFPDLRFTKRTHKSFVEQTYPEHHSGWSLLLELPNINIISDVPLDYMHLVLLGVVRKLLAGIWCHGRPPHKFSNSQITNISHALKNLGPYIPKEFARRPRSLKEVKRWKATEYRQFLLYTAPAVLKKYLPKKKYQHFLTLTVAITILSNDKLCNDFCDYAETLLHFFVKITKELYGVHTLSHNFHNLLHLADDVRKHGTLDNFSNFSSENFLQHLKTFIRKPEKPLQQMIYRYHEFVKNKNHPVQNNLDFEFIGLHYNGILTESCTGPEYKTLLRKHAKHSSNLRDSCCGLKDGTVIEIENFAFCPKQNKEVVIGKKYMQKYPFFDIPCCSSLVGIHCVNTLSEITYWPVSEINEKFVRLPYEDNYIVFPLIHTA